MLNAVEIDGVSPTATKAAGQPSSATVPCSCTYVALPHMRHAEYMQECDCYLSLCKSQYNLAMVGTKLIHRSFNQAPYFSAALRSQRKRVLTIYIRIPIRIPIRIADPQPQNSRVMVARPFADTPRPRVHVHMFDLPATLRNGVAHEDVVNFLRVLVVRVGVPLGRRYIRNIVRVVQERLERAEDGARGRIFVHVTGDNNARRRREGQDGVYKCLWAGGLSDDSEDSDETDVLL